MIKILDMTKQDEMVEKIPIKLLTCLQASTKNGHHKGLPRFSPEIQDDEEGFPLPSTTNTVIRACDVVVDNKVRSLVIVHTTDSIYPTVYIADWNDGILE